jgi:hypothetical protein
MPMTQSNNGATIGSMNWVEFFILFGAVLAGIIWNRVDAANMNTCLDKLSAELASNIDRVKSGLVANIDRIQADSN